MEDNMEKYNPRCLEEELNKITNRCIGKLFEALGDDISPAVKREIKHHLRWYQNNVRDVINVREGQNYHDAINNN